MAIGTLAFASSVLAKENPRIEPSFPVDGRKPEEYLDAAVKVNFAVCNLSLGRCSLDYSEPSPLMFSMKRSSRKMDSMQAATFVEKKLWNPETKRLKRSYCRGPSDVEGFDSDYAFLIAGLLDLFAANGDTKWLKWASELQQSMDNLFWDDKLGDDRSDTPAAAIKCLLPVNEKIGTTVQNGKAARHPHVCPACILSVVHVERTSLAEYIQTLGLHRERRERTVNGMKRLNKSWCTQEHTFRRQDKIPPSSSE